MNLAFYKTSWQPTWIPEMDTSQRDLCQDWSVTVSGGKTRRTNNRFSTFRQTALKLVQPLGVGIFIADKRNNIICRHRSAPRKSCQTPLRSANQQISNLAYFQPISMRFFLPFTLLYLVLHYPPDLIKILSTITQFLQHLLAFFHIKTAFYPPPKLIRYLLF